MADVIDIGAARGRGKERQALKCPGAGRDAGNERALCFYFNRSVTDDELRFLHDVMQRAAECMPDDLGSRK